MDKLIPTFLFLFATIVLAAQTPQELLLDNFRPQSIYHIPTTEIDKPKFPIIDAHSHAYTSSEKELEQWVETMDYFGIEKTVVLTGATGQKFDSLLIAYGKYPGRFDLWCGIDFNGSDKAGWAENAVAELERCHRAGAKGVGEITDKGMGLLSAFGTQSKGLHIDGPEADILLEKMAELNMPISVHMAEPKWMYEPMDSTNDGLMNGWTWRIDQEAEGVVLHAGLMKQFEKALRSHPRTTFIACHFLNCSYDLSILENLLNKYPNLYADISARYGETSPIPRYMKSFYEKYQDRLLYGTDMGFSRDMYRVTFRILETEDEHFYETERFRIHSALHGFGLPDGVLKKVYRENAVRVLK